MFTICWDTAGAADRSRGAETFGGLGNNGELYDVIKRPLVTEKGVTKKDAERTLCFEVAVERQQDPDPAGGRRPLFKVKVEEVRTSTTAGKLRRRGRFAGIARTGKKPT